MSVVFVVGALILYFNSVVSVFGIPYGLDFGEGYLADMSLRLAGGHNPYHTLDQPPWVVSSYPPLYPLINGLILLITGPSLAPGRLISVLSFLGMIVASVMIFRKFSVHTSVAILAAGLLLCFEWGVRWSQVVRVDTFGILLTACGVYWWLRSNKPLDAVISAIFLACAVLTKQSLLAAPVAVILHALFTRDKRGFLFFAMLAIGIAGSYGLINFATSGGFFKHLFVYTANAWFVERFVDIIQYVKATWILHVVGISAMLIPGLLRDKKLFFAIYYVLAHGNLLAYGFEGSDTNYFIEPLFATILIAGFTFNFMVESEPPQSQSPLQKIPSLKTIAYGIILAVIILGRYISPAGYQIHRAGPDQLANGASIISLASDARGLVLSEDASFTFLAGKEVVFQPYIMSLLQRTGKWDQEPFLKTLRDQSYSVIMLRVDLDDPNSSERRGGLYEMAGFDRWTDEMEQAIRDNYFLYNPNRQPLDVGTWNYWYVYLPKDLLAITD